jgi:hypothetical protein
MRRKGCGVSQVTAIDDACRAVLMFHEGGEWTAERRAEWKRITGSDEATTKVLCDHIRLVLENEHAKRNAIRDA